jgi:hypothetical protein
VIFRLSIVVPELQIVEGPIAFRLMNYGHNVEVVIREVYEERGRLEGSNCHFHTHQKSLQDLIDKAYGTIYSSIAKGIRDRVPVGGLLILHRCTIELASS